MKIATTHRHKPDNRRYLFWSAVRTTYVRRGALHNRRTYEVVAVVLKHFKNLT